MTPEDATLHYDQILRATGVSVQYPASNPGKYGAKDPNSFTAANPNGTAFPQAGLANMNRYPIDPRFIFLSPDLRTQLTSSKLLGSPSDPRIKRRNAADVRGGKYNGMGATLWTGGRYGNDNRYFIHQYAMSYGVCLGGDDQRGASLLTLTRNIAGDPKTNADFGWRSHRWGHTQIQRTLTIANIQWVGPENKIVDANGNTQTEFDRWQGNREPIKRLSMSGLDMGQGNAGKTDGSVAQVDDGTMKQALVGHFAQTGGNGTSHGRIARPYNSK
jgi:hypothetical protein